MAEQFRIKLFKPAEVPVDSVWIILGPHKSGKTRMLVDVLYHNRHKFDFAIGMTETKSTADVMRTFLPRRLVFDDGYNADEVDGFLRVCQKLDEEGKVRHSALIEDDLMGDPRFLRSTTQSKMHLNGRHWRQSIFCTSQDVMGHQPKLRAQADIVIAMSFVQPTHVKKLYTEWLGAKGFETFRDFESVYNKCTENYGAMVLDRTTGDKSVSGCIRHYRASTTVPPFRLSRPVFFLLSDVVDQLCRLGKRKKVEDPETLVVQNNKRR